MKLRLHLLTFPCFSFSNVVLAEIPAYIQTNEGIIVFTDPAFTGRVTSVKLTVIADNIVRVIASPKRFFRINFISPGNAKHFDIDAKCDKEIFYNGKKLVIKI